MPRKAISGWTKKAPTKDGWYWYRDAETEKILHVFDPWGNGVMKAWDWKDGRHLLRAIAEYEGSGTGRSRPRHDTS